MGVVLYLPARSDLNAAQNELDRLLPMESEFKEASIKAAIYEILSNVSNMQIALIEGESNRAGQYANYIEDDLAHLSIDEMSDITDALSNQFSSVSTLVESDPAAALDGLQDLKNDLLLLIDNIK